MNREKPSSQFTIQEEEDDHQEEENGHQEEDDHQEKEGDHHDADRHKRRREVGHEEARHQRSLRDRVGIRKPLRYDEYELNLAECHEPISLHEAVNGCDKKKWQEAIQDELEAHQTNGTWAMVPEDNQQLIDSKCSRSSPRRTGDDTRHGYVLKGSVNDLDLIMERLSPQL